MKIGTILHYILKNNTALAARVGTRIYPIAAPQEPTLPFVVFTQTDNTPYDTKNGVSNFDIANVQVYVFGDTFLSVESDAELIRTALDRYTGTISTLKIDSIRYLTEEPDFDPINTGWYLKRLDFQIIEKR